MNWFLVKNSFLTACAATLLAMLAGGIYGLCLGAANKTWRGCLLCSALAALALPPFLVCNTWLDLAGANGFLARRFAVNISTLPAAAFLLAAMLWPLTALMVFSRLRHLSLEQVEAEPRAGGWLFIHRLLVPQLRAALFQSGLITFALALNNFAVPAILQVKVLPAETWIVFNTTFNTQASLLLGWPLLVGPLLALFFFRRQVYSRSGAVRSLPPAIFRRQLGPWFFPCLGFSAGLVAVSVIVPLAQILSSRRTWVELPSAIAAGNSALFNSIYYSLLSSMLTFGVGVAGIILFLKRTRAGWANVFHSCAGGLLWAFFLLPGIFTGMLLIQFLNNAFLNFFYKGAGIVVVAFFLRYAVICWSGCRWAMDSHDRTLVDAALLDRAGRGRIFAKLLWPQLKFPLLALGYIVFLLTLWDVETMILIVPPGGESLATRIFGLLHYGHNPQVNALCLVLLGAALAPLLIYGGWQCWHAATPGRRAILCLTLAVMTMCFSGCREKAHVNQNRLASRSFTHVEIVGTRGVGLGQFNKPRSVAVDLQDNMYVVDMTGRVQKFSPLGHFLLSWQMPQTDLGKPKGMGRDNQGNVLVVEPHYQRINYFSIEGNLVTQWGQRGTNAGQLNLPRAVAVNSRGDVFVSEYGPVERVQHFRADGVFLDGFGHAGNGPGEFNRPEGLCIDSRDQIYVADSCNHRIQIFNAQGKFLRAYGKAGASLGEMSYPYDILVDKSGRQYVCEFGNSRIQIFDAQDKPMEIIGGPGSEPGKFNNPWGVAMDSKGALYVADSQNHRVQKLVPPAETAQAIGARKKGSF